MKTTRFLAALLAYCAVVLLPTRLYAQQSVDFSAALDLARKNNPDCRAAEQEVEVARGKLTTARLINPFNPVIEGQGGPRRIPGEGTGTDYGVGLSMEVEVAGQRGLRIGEAERNLQKVEAGFGDFARIFRAKLARALYQAVFARERMALQRRVENLNRTLLDVTKIKYQAGDVSGLEVNVSVVRYGQSRKETLDAGRNLNQALLELGRLIGVDETFVPQDKLDVTLPSVSSGEILTRALRNRPDLLSRRREVERAEAEIALVRRQVFPNPTFGVSFNREGNGEKIVHGGVSIPLPILNRRQGELESLEARRVQARSEVAALEMEIQKEVNQAVNQWETARQSADLFQREVIEQIDENFRLLEAAYRERRIDLPRLLVMENDLITGNRSYLDVLFSLRGAAIEIEEVTAQEVR
jgi:cobalt-zinc-cadmium efflux system outer membrane protein